MVDFGLEARGHFFDCLAECGGLIAKFVQLFFIRDEIGQVQFLVLAANLATHVHTKFLGEGGEIDVPLLLGVEDVAHERGHFPLRHIDFIRQQVLLKVFVGDETIAVLVELPKDVVHLVLPVEDAVLD